ncbi:MAG: NAD+ synthase [Methylococcales bacterium]|nr:NAD+ synthase [Methylococcales bacterium]
MTRKPLTIALAQLNFHVGGLTENTDRILAAASRARDELKADLIVFPELALTGYPPEDLLFRPAFLADTDKQIQRLLEAIDGIAVVVGAPEFDQGRLYNSALVVAEGRMIARYRKRHLPNYGVFDEARYFQAGDSPMVFDCQGYRLGLTVCEDIWQEGLIAEIQGLGAEMILTLNASPFHAGKIHQREHIVCRQAKAAGLPLVYVNLIGGQDELVFDGASFVTDAQGEVVFRAPEFEENLAAVSFDQGKPLAGALSPLYREVSSEYQALILGIRDYVNKNGFRGVLLGLSGGIDSALVLALAVDALGADNVRAVLMPSRYTSEMSIEDAKAQAEAMGAAYDIIGIEPAVEAFAAMLKPVLADAKGGVTSENIQARCRGIILMALSNQWGKLLLTTGNKSEMSVGYATLYGDMAGGFAPIKDVPKLLVYQLARYRNGLSSVIPERVLTRPPTAELAPDQFDQDSLPPYEILDPILERYVERDQSAEEIIAQGFAADVVRRVITLVDRNEYKRRQSPPCIRITERAFGRDRRYPITSGYRDETC